METEEKHHVIKFTRMGFLHPLLPKVLVCVCYSVWDGTWIPQRSNSSSYLDLFSQEKWILQEQNVLTSIIPKDGGST